MRKAYLESLDELQELFIEYLKETHSLLVNSIGSFKDQKLRDFEFKKQLINVKDMGDQIEKSIFTIIARQAPVSVDLRLILGILKNVPDINRIATTSIRITKFVKKFGDEEEFQTKKDATIYSLIEEMGDVVIRMLNQVIEVTVSDGRLDTSSAKELQQTLIEQDDDVDSLFKETIKKFVSKIQKEADSKKQAKQIAEGLMMVRHLERIGDHICNIAERLVYIDTGKRLPIY